MEYNTFSSIKTSKAEGYISRCLLVEKQQQMEDHIPIFPAYSVGIFVIPTRNHNMLAIKPYFQKYLSFY